MKYYQIFTNGNYGIITSTVKPDLTEMQNIVGGYIEMIPLPTDRSLFMVVNEDGRGLDLLYNRKASKIAPCSILGNVMIIRVSFGGETVSLTDGDIDLIKRGILS